MTRPYFLSVGFIASPELKYPIKSFDENVPPSSAQSHVLTCCAFHFISGLKNISVPFVPK